MRVLGRLAQFSRGFTTSAVRRSAGDYGGQPGSNLPFDIHNHRKLAVYFVLFFGSGVSLPFIVVRQQLLKDS